MPFFYHAILRVDGMLWYHSTGRPTVGVYAHSPLPVIHNYGLTLELAGYIVDPDMGYASLFSVTRYKQPIQLYRRYGVYSYPAVVTKPLLRELIMSAIGEALVEVKRQGRLAYPDLTRNTVLMPGSELETLVMSQERLPEKLVLRIGAKRYGVLQARLYPVRPKFVDAGYVTHPFNVADSVKVDGFTVMLKHEAGDIGVLGRAVRALTYKIRRGNRVKVVVLPVLRGTTFHG